MSRLASMTARLLSRPLEPLFVSQIVDKHPWFAHATGWEAVLHQVRLALDAAAETMSAAAQKATPGTGANVPGAGAKKNVAPTAQDDFFSADADAPTSGSVLANDSDKNGDPLTVIAVNGQASAVGQTITLASGASLMLKPGGFFDYTQNGAFAWLQAGQTAVDTVTYTISDGRGGADSAKLQFTITGKSDNTPPLPDNSPPDAVDDAFSTDQNSAVSASVLTNDSDPDGHALTVTAVNGQSANVGKAINLASGATVTLQSDGTFTYDPNGAFPHLNTGQDATDSFSYTISDGHDGSDTATVRFTITGIPEDTSGGGTSGNTAPSYAINDLLSGKTWSTTTLTYAFLDSVPGYYGPSEWAHNDFRSFTAQQQEMTRGALAMIENYSNLTFVETTQDKAAITFGIADLPGWSGYAYYPSGYGVNSKAGDVWIDTATAKSTFTPGASPYMILIHEIGHAISLPHSSTLSGAEGTRMYTVMSSKKHPYASGEPQTHMLYDIAAIQQVYGANTHHAAGDDVYDFAALHNRVQTLWEAGGNDTFDLSNAPYAVKLDLREGSFSTVAPTGRDNLAIAYGTIIENAIGGAGNDILIGNAVGNRLGGGPGDDVLTGGGGNNVFVFGPAWGRDTITDFTRGADRLDLWDTNLAFADLTIFASGNDTIIAHDDDQITLLGLNNLGQSDFLFNQMALIA